MAAATAAVTRDIDRENKGRALNWKQVRELLPPKLDGDGTQVEWGEQFVKALMRRIGAFRFAKTLYVYERDLNRYIDSLSAKPESDDGDD